MNLPSLICLRTKKSPTLLPLCTVTSVARFAEACNQRRGRHRAGVNGDAIQMLSVFDALAAQKAKREREGGGDIARSSKDTGQHGQHHLQLHHHHHKHHHAKNKSTPCSGGCAFFSRDNSDTDANLSRGMVHIFQKLSRGSIQQSCSMKVAENGQI